jgi:S1-C subfamily serine protease
LTDRTDHDDAERTRRHDLPAPEGAASDREPVQPLTPGTGGPDPADAWSRHTDVRGTAAPIPERWYEPAPAPVPAAPLSASRTGARGGRGTVFAAALLSAVLASGGTVLTLGAVGAFDRETAPAASPVGSNAAVGQPVTIDESSATIDVAAAVSPAVVRITTSANVGTDLGVIPESGVGSGVIYDSAGWILTNRHVVEGSEQMQVELHDGRVLPGEVYGIDTLTDLAIVKVEGTDLPTAALGSSDSLEVGQLVIAIGSPLGTYSNSVTSGIVSAKGRSITTDGNQNLNNLIQTDAAINPGNSGGPLLDANGSVVGINTAIARDSNGIGFAIPIDIARPIMEQAVAGEELSRPYMGVSYVSITRQLADVEDLPVTDGALIGGGDGGDPAVQPNTPAAEAGLRDGDIITKINGQAIDGEHPLDATLSQFAPDDTISLEVLRDGQTITVALTLGERPAGL